MTTPDVVNAAQSVAPCCFLISHGLCRCMAATERVCCDASVAATDVAPPADPLNWSFAGACSSLCCCLARSSMVRHDVFVVACSNDSVPSGSEWEVSLKALESERKSAIITWFSFGRPCSQPFGLEGRNARVAAPLTKHLRASGIGRTARQHSFARLRFPPGSWLS